jgi:hypothetical protein
MSRRALEIVRRVSIALSVANLCAPLVLSVHVRATGIPCRVRLAHSTVRSDRRGVRRALGALSAQDSVALTPRRALRDTCAVDKV